MHAIFAYIDPGTGSYLLQIGLGSLFGAVYAVRHFWSRITRVFRRPSSPDPNDAIS